MLFVIIKHNIRTCDVNFAGGTHGLTAMAAALAAAGHHVHLLYCSSKAAVFQKALLHGFVAAISYSQHTGGVVQWTEASGVVSHVSLTDVEGSYSGALTDSLAGFGFGDNTTQLPTTAKRLFEEACGIASSENQAPSYVILDNDGCSGALFQALASRFQRHLLLLIQNIHFLPFGPEGTAARAPDVLNLWPALGGILCVSEFVAGYIRAHTQTLGVNPSRIGVVGYNAWGTFGGPDAAQDFSGIHTQQIMAATAAAAAAGVGGTTDGSSGRSCTTAKPEIGMLKLTPEKGAALFRALAQQLPQYNFIAVTGDQTLLQQQQQQQRYQPESNQHPNHHQQQQQQLLPSNLTLIEPASDLNQLLQHLHLVLAPSFWQEAFGMVVVDAMLRGVPVISSNQGGLPEAGLGVAAHLPVIPLKLPLLTTPTPSPPLPAGTSSGGGHPWSHSSHSSGIGGVYPRWEDRQVVSEGQPVGLWAEAVQRLLGDAEQYERAAKAARVAAVAYVAAQPQELQRFLHWVPELQGLGA